MSGSSPKSISISGVETDITIGKELAAVAQKSKALASRDCFEQLEMYLHGRSHDRVCLLFGLLQTGKNTMLRQAIGRMTKEDLSRIAYIKARRTDNMAMMNRDLKKLFNAGFRYVFIDEVTLMEDFIDSAALFSDVFATMGMKIVLSGTDSLGFWLAMDEELYDRAKSIHTTFIPYREYSRLLGIDSIDEYIRYGGTLRAGELAFDDEDVNAQDASFRDDESTRRYIDTAICKNIQHSLACYESGGHFRHLYSLYEAGELTSAINRIIEDMNHRFLISVLTDDFLSHDLRLTAANLRKERDPEKRTEALDAIDTEAVTQRLMELLDIRNKEEQSIGITTAHIIEIKQYLTALELIVDCPIESADPGIEPVEHILFTQPGMRYCQAQALIHSLLKDEQFSALSEYDKTQVTTDRYGRKIPKHAHGTVNLDGYTSSGEELLKAATSLYDRIVDKTLLARRLTLCANHLLDESSVPEDLPEQIDLFTDYSAKEKQKKEADTAHARERKLQETMLDIKKRFGKNAILKGLNLEDGATARERNNQIGGHKA